MNGYKDMPLSEFLEDEYTSQESKTETQSETEQIPEYIPTTWIDDTEPDIDADHLNHIEEGIKNVTDAVNTIIEGGAGSFVPSDGYVYVNQEESEENPDPVDVPLLDADTFGGQLPSYYAPQHEISDAFSEGKAYVAGEYCIYLNALYRFTSPKPAGPWDGTKVVPVTVMGELERIVIGENISSQVVKVETTDTFIAWKFGNFVELWGYIGQNRSIPSGEKIATIPQIIRPTHTVTGTARGNSNTFGMVVVNVYGETFIHFNPANPNTWYDFHIIYTLV